MARTSLVAAVIGACVVFGGPGHALETCVGFEDVPLGATYNVGDSFVSSGVFVNHGPFTWSNGTVFSGGESSIQNGGNAGGSGQELWLNNINAHFFFGFVASGLSLNFGAFGGNLNISINNDFRNFNQFSAIHGLVIGGVNVSVADLGGGLGILKLDGEISQFFVGGQEFVIDDVCARRECALNLGLSYTTKALTINFLVGTDQPADWNVWLIIGPNAILLWSVPLPAIPATPLSVPIPGFPSIGTIGVLTTLSTAADGIICYDFEVVDTGP